MRVCNVRMSRQMCTSVHLLMCMCGYVYVLSHRSPVLHAGACQPAWLRACMHVCVCVCARVCVFA